MQHEVVKGMKPIRLLCGLVIACVSAFSLIYAELPPFAYKDMQAKAPEAIQIEVQSVTAKSSKQQRFELISYTVTAKVLAVDRTATGLVPGKVIEIRYEQRNYVEPLAGPSEVPTLKEHEKVPAFLTRAEGQSYYTPAAGGYTFRKVTSG